MRVLSWNTAGRRSRVDAQVAAIAQRGADVVCLQEIRTSTASGFRDGLRRAGLPHALVSLEVAAAPQVLKGPRQYGVLIASRWQFRRLRSFPIPWPEKALSVAVDTTTGTVEVHTVHVPPGSSNGWTKIRTFDGVFRRLARASSIPRILCGDFNAPQWETTDGRVVTWGQDEIDGRLVYWGKYGEGTGKDWDAGERQVLEGLASFDLPDAFRRLHGFRRQEFSWYLKRKGKVTGRRFDHVFASTRFRIRACHYLHAERESGLSDHSPLEVDLEIARDDGRQGTA